MTTTSEDPSTSSHDQLRLALRDAACGTDPLDDELWQRLRSAWPPDELARVLREHSIDPLRWAGPLAEDRPPVVVRRTPPAVVTAIAAIGVFMAFLDDTVVTIAFPDLAKSFADADLSDLSWVLNAYNVAFAALMVPAGRLADRFGRRRLSIVGILAFTFASALAAVAPSLELLVAARGLQGVGAAIVVPSSLAIVLDGTSPQRRAQAVAAWSATAALAAGLGPSVGGALVSADGWRLVFVVNLPIGLAAWLLTRRLVTESRAPGRRERVDLPGAALVAVIVGALVLAIVEGPEWGWTHAGVLGSAAVALTASVQLVRRCRTVQFPALDLELLRTPGHALTSALTFVGSTGFFALGLANVLFLITVWGYSPLRAGLATTPAPFLAVVAAAAAGWLTGRVDARRLVVAGGLVWTAGPLALILLMTEEPNYLGAYLPAAAVLAVGVGFAFPLISDAAVALAARGRYAGASALNGTVRQVGAAIGVAVLAVLLGERAGAGGIDEFRLAWAFAAACFGVLAIGALALPRLPEPDLGDDDELVAQRGEVAARASSGSPRDRHPLPTTRPATAPLDDRALLARVSLFESLPPDAHARLVATCTTERLLAGEWLFHRGDPADALFVVRSGRLELVEERSDGAEVFNELGRGAVVGELGLLSGAPRNASVRARRDAVLLRLDRAEFEAELATRSGYAVTVARLLAEQLQRTRIPVQRRGPRAVTLAVVHSTGEPRCAAFAGNLVAALSGLRRTARLSASDVVREGAEVGVSLAQSLDNLEPHHDLVVLSAVGNAVDDAWLEACLRQADRVLLVVDDEVTAWSEIRGARFLKHCDIALLGSPGRPDCLRLLDTIDPASTHRVRTHDDVRRLARRLAGRAVGVVLSGGGARAFAHIGVLEELRAAGIAVDRVGGASMGAFIGALAAAGVDAEEILARCHLEFVRRNPIGDYQLPLSALTRGARARAMLERQLPGLIEDLPLPFYCVSTDLISAELVVHRRGEIAPAVGASMCLPGVAPPVALDQRLLVDGAVLDCLPVTSMARHEGPIIASDVTEPEQRTLEPGEAPPRIGLVDTLARAMLLSTTDTEEVGRRHSDLYIAPDHEHVGQLEFHMIDRMRLAGRRATLAALESAPADLFG